MSRIFILLISILWASLVFISWEGVAETAPSQTVTTAVETSTHSD